ncbi:hypothetical protein ABZZ20_32025 [Streptomyces sp. NPDC006430]|uniref:hypothetical protein n=1 Tax=Streptomyces sp. NPDC006430 TaxID=3154299 RepID=UPI0033B1FD0A
MNVNVDRESRRLAWCVALLLRHAPDAVASDVLRRLDAPTRRFLCRDEALPASTVTLLLREGSDEDRRLVARNPRVFGRPLPGLPGPARYAARTGPRPELFGTLRAELAGAVAGPSAARTAEQPPDPAAGSAAGPGLSTAELAFLLRRHGRRRPRVPLALLRLPYEQDPAALLAEHARAPFAPGAVEALLLVGGLPREACLGLLDSRARRTYGPGWHRPAVRAVRMGLITFDELVTHTAPAHRTLLLTDLTVRGALRWNLPEKAELRTAVGRVLRPALGDDPRRWTELARCAPGFDGTLPELAAAVAAGTASAAQRPDPAPVAGLARAVEALGPSSPWPAAGGVDRELALASLGVPNAMGDIHEDIRWVRACLDRRILTGADVIRYKAPAAWALDEDHWLGDIDHPDRHDRHPWVLEARAEADRLLDGALGTDADAWWRAARTLPEFIGSLPDLLAQVSDGDSVSKRS